MSLLNVLPDSLTAATGNLQHIGAGLRAANAAAATQTTAIAAPATDEVSAAVTALLGTHAEQFQALSARAAVFHDDFVNLLNGGAARYVSTETANAQQALASVANAPAQGLLGVAEPNSPATFINNLTAMNQTSNFGPFAISSSVSSSGVFQSITLNGPFGPVASMSLTAASIVPSEVTGFGGFVANASGSLHTPFGPVELFSYGGSHLVTPNGGFSTSFSSGSGFSTEGVALNGSVPLGITGGSITTNGMQFWFQGTQFGVTPLFLRSFGLA
jgi:hypothetical protein